MEVLESFRFLLHQRLQSSSIPNTHFDVASLFLADFRDMPIQTPPFLLRIAALTSICACILALTWLLLQKFRLFLPRDEKAGVYWFAVWGVFNLFFIGDMLGCLLLNGVGMCLVQGSTDSNQWMRFGSVFGKSGADPFVLYFQAVTVIILAPLSLTLAFLIATQNMLRHPLQIAVCFGQLYSMVLYCGNFLISDRIDQNRLLKLAEKPKDIQPDLFLNFVLIAFLAVFPLVLLHSSISTILRIFAAFQKISHTLSQRRKPTPMKPYISSRRISTASITVSKLDFGKLVSVKGDNDLNCKVSLDSRQDVKEESKEVKVEEKEEEEGEKTGEEREETPNSDYGTEQSSTLLDSDSQPDTCQLEADNESILGGHGAEESRAALNSDSLSGTSQFQINKEPIPGLDAQPASAVLDSDSLLLKMGTVSILSESDDESLGEIVIDPAVVIEGIRKRNLRH